MLPDINAIRAITTEQMKSVEQKQEEERLKQEELFKSNLEVGIRLTLQRISEEITKCANKGESVCSYKIDVDTKLGSEIYKAVYAEVLKSTQYNIKSIHIDSPGNDEYPSMDYMAIDIKW
jgi:hypothetical protein